MNVKQVDRYKNAPTSHNMHFLVQKSFPHQIVTADKSWVYYENQIKLKYWVDPLYAARKKPKQKLHSTKLLLCVWWDIEGILFMEFIFEC